MVFCSFHFFVLVKKIYFFSLQKESEIISQRKQHFIPGCYSDLDVYPPLAVLVICCSEKIVLSGGMCFLVKECTASGPKCGTVKYMFVFRQCFFFFLWWHLWGFHSSCAKEKAKPQQICSKITRRAKMEGTWERVPSLLFSSLIPDFSRFGRI